MSRFTTKTTYVNHIHHISQLGGECWDGLPFSEWLFRCQGVEFDLSFVDH